MLRNLSAALLATALIAGPAFAGQPSGNAGSTVPAAPAATTAPAPAGGATQTVTNRNKTSKTVKHVRKHARNHVAHGKTDRMKQARHVKPTKVHASSVSHNAKPGNRSNKSST